MSTGHGGARDVIANGQFILTSRTAYETAGTHAAVRHEVAEDLALAQTYVGKGLKLHFAFADRLMETRMYEGLSSLIEGWSKNVYLGGRRSFPKRAIPESPRSSDADQRNGVLAGSTHAVGVECR